MTRAAPSPPPPPLPVDEQCDDLCREADARAVLVLDEDGSILGHAGAIRGLAAGVVDGLADQVAAVLLSAARGEMSAEEDLVVTIEDVTICAAPLDAKRVIAVIMSDAANLFEVRESIRAARGQLLRSIAER